MEYRPGGYKLRYPHTWKEEVKVVISRKYCCITDLIDHMVSEAERIFSNTIHANDYVIYHDALSLLMSAETQQYLRDKNFYHLFFRCLPGTNDNNRYAGKVVGDSPELCRGLDAHGFADLERCINYNIAVTCILPLDDPRRFKGSTPKELWSSMERSWQVEPNSSRIVEDISNLSFVLEKIIDAEGCIVLDYNLRRGRRFVSLKDNVDLKNKPRSRQRKTTQSVPTPHPDILEALQTLGEMHSVDIIKAIDEYEIKIDDDDDLPKDDELKDFDDAHDD